MEPSRWRFGQCFGEREGDVEDFSEADVLSAVEFDPSGDYLATGDNGGRIVLFERSDAGKSKKRRRPPAGAGTEDEDMEGCGIGQPAEFRFHTEFQSHESEFDYLKSLEIEERINTIAWCGRSNGALHLLSTNDKTIKLWKVYDRSVKVLSSMNVETGRYGGHVPVTSLRIPRLTSGDATQVVATPRRVFGNVHVYHIHSVSANSDGATFLSSDDLRINLWSLDNAKLSFNIVDLKPPSLEELTEVITSACFHPQSCSTFLYSTSRGSVRQGDMRAAALCDRQAKYFDDVEEGSSKSYLTEIIASVSDVTFSRCGRYIVSRDYLRVKIWDTAMEGRGPLLTIPVHDYLRPRLSELYDSDCIFDKFEVGISPSGTSVVTGSYGNAFRIYDYRLAPVLGGIGHMGADPGLETSVELCKQAQPSPPVMRPIPPVPLPSMYDGGLDSNGYMLDGTGDTGPGSEALRPPPGVDLGSTDFSRKVLHYSFHPHDDIIAVAGLNNLYVYYGVDT